MKPRQFRNIFFDLLDNTIAYTLESPLLFGAKALKKVNQPLRNTHISLLLAAMLMAAQCALLIHQAEFEEHAGGEACEFCIHYSSFNDNIDNDDTLLFTTTLNTTQDSQNHSDRVLTPTFSNVRARAPPYSSIA